MTAAIAGVTLDVWNTLVRENWPLLVDFRTRNGAHATGLSRSLVSDILNDAWSWNRREWSAGRFHSTSDSVAHVLGERPEGTRRAQPWLAAAFGGLPPVEAFEFDPRTREILGELSARGVRLGIICDTGFSSGAVMRDFLKPLLPPDAIDVWVFSDELKSVKPAEANFLRACDGMGLPPECVLHVGDLVINDFDGARRVGMHSVVITKWVTEPSRDVPTIPDLGVIGTLIPE